MAKRPNGTGNVYKRKSTWTARCVDHYIEIEVPGNTPEETVKILRPVWKTKGGFPTKRDALNYLPTLLQSARNEHPPKKFNEVFKAWKAKYEPRVSAKTIEGYEAAFQHYKAYHFKRIDTISATDLQSCIDACKHGKRTKQLMKVIAGLVFKYAIDDNQTNRNPATNLYVGSDETTHYEPLTDQELEKIEKSGLRYADYIVAMCYLGHRPAEFFGFKKSDFHEEDGTYYLLGGVKTEAGRTRAVTIPPKVLPIVKLHASIEGSDYLFPRLDLNRKGQPTGYSQMPVRYFNKYIWKPIMDALGIVGKVPYATRHTYANKMKAVQGDEKDKAGLMGHASYETTRKHYQSTSLPEKKAITDQMK